MMSRTPQSAATKRCLDRAFDDVEEASNSSNRIEQNLSKRFNHSNQDDQINLSGKNFRLETHIFETSVKESITKIAYLEHELLAEKNERTKMEIEFNTYKLKQANELKALQEVKEQLESALKSSKTNEKLALSEMNHLRNEVESIEKAKLPEKDKEIKSLKQQIETLQGSIEESKFENHHENRNLKFELDSKKSEIERLENELIRFEEVKKALGDVNIKLEEMKKENALMVNELRDLKSENEKLGENMTNFSKFSDQSSQIVELERDNRKLKSDLEYFKVMQEKNHFYQEELESKTKQIERFEKKIVNLELENNGFKQQIKQIKEAAEKADSKSSIIDQLKATIANLDADNLKSKEKNNALSEEIHALKVKMNDKNEEIVELQKRVSRLTSENTGFQRIISMYDTRQDINVSDDAETVILRKRINELEQIINEQKKAANDSGDLKLVNDQVFHLQQENANSVSIGVQVNLVADVYANYEKKIEGLYSDLSELREKHERLLSQISDKENDLDKENRRQIVDAEVEDLEKKLADQIVINQRQMSEFRKRSSEILRILRSLLGYKVYFDDESQIKLVCVNNVENFLIFKFNHDASLSLRDTSFARKNMNLMNTFIRDHHSNIGFLAAILFDMNDRRLAIDHKY